MRFQLHSGARVATRSLAPVAVGAVAASVMYGTPMVVIGISEGLFYSPDVSVGCAALAVAAGLLLALVG